MAANSSPNRTRFENHDEKPAPSHEETITCPLSALADIASQQQYLPVPERRHSGLLLLAKAAENVLGQEEEEKIEDCIIVSPLPDKD
jgi:hypothetical protein